MDRGFFKVFWTSKSPNLCQGAPCVCTCVCVYCCCYWMLSILPAVYNTALVFASWLQSLNVAQKEEIRTFLYLSLVCTELWTWFPEIDQSFQSVLWAPYVSIFPFLVRLLFAPTVVATSGSYSVRQLPLIGFGKCSENRTVCTEGPLSQVK